MKYKTSIFIFRRDLRLYDNTGLLHALENSEKVIPCFIFDPRQIENNAFRSNNALQFMLDSLRDLQGQLRKVNARLYLFWGEPDSVIKQVVQSVPIDAIYYNRDYTPFSMKRDEQLERVAKKNRMEIHSHSDSLLTEVGTVMTGKGTPYTVYSHFLKKAAAMPIPSPTTNSLRNYLKEPLQGEVPDAFQKVIPKDKLNKDIFISGGRKHALRILKNIGEYSDYDELRDFPEKEATTGLSAHNKFGTVSVREVYSVVEKNFGRAHTLIRELYWRDFFTHVAFHFPHVFGNSYHSKYQNLSWRNDKKKFSAWCKGRTGFPIVDAGMRQLESSGFMHNRVRMIVASFLVKDLHIDWRWGEKYFAQNLIDYDPAVNNGNWQWAASTGCDAQPYFRIFNPWIQGKKFDLECRYIKRWIPELRAYDAKEIHKLEKGNILDAYVAPIVNHAEAKQVAEDMFLEASEKFANA